MISSAVLPGKSGYFEWDTAQEKGNISVTEATRTKGLEVATYLKKIKDDALAGKKIKPAMSDTVHFTGHSDSEDLQQQLAPLKKEKDQLRTLRRTISTLNKLVVSQAERVQKLTVCYGNAQREITALDNELEQLKNKQYEAITPHAQSLHEAQTQLVKLNNEKTSLAKFNQQLTEENKCLLTELKQAEAYIRGLEVQAQNDADRIARLIKDQSENEATLELIKAEHAAQLQALVIQAAQTRPSSSVRGSRTPGKKLPAQYYMERRHNRMTHCLDDFRHRSLSGRRTTPPPVHPSARQGTRQTFVPAAMPARIPEENATQPGRYTRREPIEQTMLAAQQNTRRRRKYPRTTTQHKRRGTHHIRRHRTADWVASERSRRRSAADSQRIAHREPAFGWSPSTVGKKDLSTQTAGYTPNGYPQPEMSVMLSAMCQLVETTMKTFLEGFARIFGGTFGDTMARY